VDRIRSSVMSTAMPEGEGEGGEGRRNYIEWCLFDLDLICWMESN
jgi:hypothetical protein